MLAYLHAINDAGLVPGDNPERDRNDCTIAVLHQALDDFRACVDTAAPAAARASAPTDAEP